MFRHVWQKYLTVLNQRPLSTQMVQSSVIMAVGDVIAQKVVEKHEGFDVVRTARFAMMGTFFVVRRHILFHHDIEAQLCDNDILSF